MHVRRMHAIIGDCGRSPNDDEDPAEDWDLTESWSRERYEAFLGFFGLRTISDIHPDDIEEMVSRFISFDAL